MRTLPVPVLLTLSLTPWSAAFAASTAPALPPGMKLISKGSIIQGAPEAWKLQMSNGARLLILPDDRNAVATLRILFDGGSDREVKGRTGLAHFFEHMMFRKTRQTDEGHYSRFLAAIGGKGNAGTSSDYVVYHSTFPAPALGQVMELEAQRMKDLEIADPYFTTEKGAVVSERALHYDNVPAARGKEIIRAITERGTPYEWQTIGIREDVLNMDIASAKEFYKNFYTPDNALITVGGPVTVEDAAALVHKHFGSWQGKVQGKRLPLPGDYTTRDAGKSFICSEDVGEQTYSITYPALTHTYRDVLLGQVVSELLDDHPEGKMERRFIKAKLATKAGFYKSSWQRFTQPAVAVLTLSKGQKFEEARKAWLAEVDAALKRPFTERLRKRLLKKLSLAEAELSLKMTDLVENYEDREYVWGNFLIEKEDRKFFSTVKETEIRSWIRENLDPKHFYITGVVPSGMAQPCAELPRQK